MVEDRFERRHAGFDRSRAVPEVVAALNALTAVGAADAAPVIIRLVEQGGQCIGPLKLALAQILAAFPAPNPR